MGPLPENFIYFKEPSLLADCEESMKTLPTAGMFQPVAKQPSFPRQNSRHFKINLLFA
jgi:hypothetical protein